MYILIDPGIIGGFMLKFIKRFISNLVSILKTPEQSTQESEAVVERTLPYDNHDLIIDRIIHAMAVNTHRTSDISRLEVLCNNIVDYTQLMIDVKLSLVGERSFPREDLSLRLVKVCNFYRGHSGTFISIPIWRGKMLDAMLDVVTTHQKALAVKNPPGWLAHALMRTTTVMINIDMLSSRLVEPAVGE